MAYFKYLSWYETISIWDALVRAIWSMAIWNSRHLSRPGNYAGKNVSYNPSIMRSCQIKLRLKMGFRHNFLHPKWLRDDLDLSKLSVSQKANLQSFLSTFLEIGRFILLKEKLRKLCGKWNVGRRHSQKHDVTRIASWQVLIVTLVDLADNTSE